MMMSGSPVCHYSENPGRAPLIMFFIGKDMYREDVPRPNLVIEVNGGEGDEDGKLLCCVLGERRFFEMVDDPEYVREACQGAVG